MNVNVYGYFYNKTVDVQVETDGLCATAELTVKQAKQLRRALKEAIADATVGHQA
jgi:predicted ATP-grasp superfamily ATP-dependent carboligase